MVYDGGVLTPSDIDDITVPDGELAGFASYTQIASLSTAEIARNDRHDC